MDFFKFLKTNLSQYLYQPSGSLSFFGKPKAPPSISQKGDKGRIVNPSETFNTSRPGGTRSNKLWTNLTLQPGLRPNGHSVPEQS